MTVQNPHDNLGQNQINYSKTQADLPKTRVDSTKSKPDLTRSESVEKTNKKIGLFQAKIKGVIGQGGTESEKQKNLEKLETKILKTQRFFNQIDAELNSLSGRKNELNAKLGNIHESGPAAELYREELKSVTIQIHEIEELKASGYGGGASLVSSSLQQVQASLAELKREAEMSQLMEDLTFANELFPKEIAGIDESHAQVMNLVGQIPNENREKIAQLAKGLFTEKMDVHDRMAVVSVLKELAETIDFDLLGAFKNVPPAQMLHIINLAKQLESKDMSKYERRDLIQYVGRFEQTEREKLVDIANALFTKDMNVTDKFVLLGALADLPRTQREDPGLLRACKNLSPSQTVHVLNLITQAWAKDVDKEAIFEIIGFLEKFSPTESKNLIDVAQKLFTPDLDIYSKLNLLNDLSKLPVMQREDPGGYAFKLIASGQTFGNAILPYVLKNQEFREEVIAKSLSKLKDAENLSETTVKGIASYVYKHRSLLQLHEGHPLLQLASLNYTNTVSESGINLTYLDSKNLAGTDSKINTISQKQLETFNKMKSERTTIVKTKAEDLNLGEEMQTIELRSANVTEQEAKSFQQALGNYDSPGKIGDFIIHQEFEPLYPQNQVLENGNTIFAGEQCAINIMTSMHYQLVNGTLAGEKSSVDRWKNEIGNYGKNATDEFVSNAQGHVMQIAEMAASGINKLPPYKGILYRGAAVNNEKLEGLRQGIVMMTKKFYSCSTNVDVCEKFAKDGAVDNTLLRNEEYKPVLYVFKSENAKDIQAFSQYGESEEERIYAPGQGFRSVSVDEKTIPGLAIVYMEEMH